MRKTTKTAPMKVTQIVERVHAIWYSDKRRCKDVAKEFDDLMVELKTRAPEIHARIHEEFEQELIAEQFAEDIAGGAYGW